MTSRRQFIKLGAAIGAGLIMTRGGETLLNVPDAEASVQSAQTPLSSSGIPQFVDPLPTFVGLRQSSQSLTASIQEFQQKVLPAQLYASLPAPFNGGTFLWGYAIGNCPPSYPGCTIEAGRGYPTTILYINNLPSFANSQVAARLTVDQTIHWADPLNQMSMMMTTPYQGYYPTVTHLHGAEVPSAFDGGPEQWFTRNGLRGQAYATYASTAPNSAVYWYPNTQEATTLWMHDHTMGMTRLNVVSGLAAFYLLRDQYDSGQPNNPLGLPAGAQEIELMIQDRQFDTQGQLLFPDGTPTGNPSGLNGPPPNPQAHPYWIPEFFGDAIVVNGKTWPYLNVEPRRYRFRLLNGSNARFYRLHLVDSTQGTPGPSLWQIGTDGSLLDAPVQLSSDPLSSNALLLAPAERADLIIDFSGLNGHNFTLTNDAPAPFPDGDNPDPATTGRIMQFRVGSSLSSPDNSYNPASGARLRGSNRYQPPALVRLANAQQGSLASGVTPSLTRQLILIENEGPGGPLEVLVNNTKWTGLREGTQTPIPGSQPIALRNPEYLTELPRTGSTEVWEIINLTEDAHPIHIHLVQFQLINRQQFDKDAYFATYSSLFPGGTYTGVLPDGSLGPVTYPPGVYIPGYGPPQTYTTPNSGGALGGNPDVKPYLQGSVIPPDANEAGWKDTIKIYPGQVGRLALRWAPTALAVSAVYPGENHYVFDPTAGPGYVWHCHILDHEDNEMMRPYIPVR
ncbi:multicopper oxidase family protein [Dictyobacter aurantiacus]|uniref:Spore coat protein n=1 Tax=Dictyobacter aurantiacus TaxID=1936993 RepID=A0A401ZKK1_9CHLR|nr:multicopper oxidase [Dictyobacter aurantiacus]GCE07358.1 spore coat protein [Dictyobacter aurantiacus]